MPEKIEIDDLSDLEEDLLSTFSELLLTDGFTEDYHQTADFDPDEIMCEASINNVKRAEAGEIDDDVYFIWYSTNFIYIMSNTEINILNQFKQLCEEYRNA